MVTRAEVYGLFVATLLVGGGTVAFATDQTVATDPVTTVASSTPTATPVQAEVVAEVVAEPVVQDPVVAQTVEEIPHQVEYRERGPWIGSGDRIHVDASNYICAWATNGYGGRGYGYGPEAVCNQEYLNYISSNCGVKDENGMWSGIIDRQLCNEWESHTLRIDY